MQALLRVVHEDLHQLPVQGGHGQEDSATLAVHQDKGACQRGPETGGQQDSHGQEFTV